MLKKKKLVYTLIVFTFFIQIKYSIGEELWLTDVKNGCKIEGNAKTKVIKGSFIEWEGKCVQGKGEGYGKLRWYSEGVNYQTEIFSDDTGVILDKGIRKSILKGNAINLKLKSCDKGTAYRQVEVIIPAEVDIRQWAVVSDLLSRAEQYAWKMCPAKSSFKKEPKLSNVVVTILQNGERVVRARSKPKNVLTGGGGRYWGEYTNYIVTSSSKEADRLLSNARAEKRRKQKHAKQEAEKREKEEVVKRQLEFFNTNSVKQWVSSNELNVNPFKYEGDVVALKTRLSKMLSSKRGLFHGDFVLSDIPKNKIVDQNEVIIAGQVLGNIPLKTQFGGEILLPHLEYRSVYFCQRRGCKDIIP